MAQQTDNAAKPIKIPGPDHPIIITEHHGRVIVTVAGEVIADTLHALALKEASYPPVLYIPRRDVKMALLETTSHTTHCPYKGACSYFSIGGGEDRVVNVAWSYEAPHEAVAQIREFIAFYPDRVDQIEELSR